MNGWWIIWEFSGSVSSQIDGSHGASMCCLHGAPLVLGFICGWFMQGRGWRDWVWFSGSRWSGKGFCGNWWSQPRLLKDCNLQVRLGWLFPQVLVNMINHLLNPSPEVWDWVMEIWRLATSFSWSAWLLAIILILGILSFGLGMSTLDSCLLSL